VSLPGSLPQSIGLEGVKNARELGGYPAAEGQVVRHGLLLRTGTLFSATAGDLSRLTGALHLGAVADLRTTREWTARPDPPISGVKLYHLLVLDENEARPSPVAADAARFQASDRNAAFLTLVREGRFNREVYRDILLSPWGREAYRAFFMLLLRAGGRYAVLFHCNSGKDRTGIAAALLLSALGVERETVLADFALTNRYLAAERSAAEAYALSHGASDGELRQVLGLAGVDRERLEMLLDTLDRRYGGVENYLTGELGLTAADLAQLRRDYLYTP